MEQAKSKQFAIVIIAAIPASQMTLRWLEKHKILDEAEAAAAIIPTQTDKLSLIKAGGVDFLADGTRLQLSTTDLERVLPMFDYAEDILGLLSSFKITSLGINASSHYDIQSVREWNRIGDKMAPKEPWRKILSGHVGLLSVRMQGERTDGRLGYRVVVVEPSKEVPHGVFIHLNEHVEIDSSKSPDEGAQATLEAVRHYRINIIKESLEIETHILE